MLFALQFDLSDLVVADEHLSRDPIAPGGDLAERIYQGTHRTPVTSHAVLQQPK